MSRRSTMKTVMARLIASPRQRDDADGDVGGDDPDAGAALERTVRDRTRAGHEPCGEHDAADRGGDGGTRIGRAPADRRPLRPWRRPAAPRTRPATSTRRSRRCGAPTSARVRLDADALVGRRADLAPELEHDRARVGEREEGRERERGPAHAPNTRRRSSASSGTMIVCDATIRGRPCAQPRATRRTRAPSAPSTRRSTTSAASAAGPANAARASWTATAAAPAAAQLAQRHEPARHRPVRAVPGVVVGVLELVEDAQLEERTRKAIANPIAERACRQRRRAVATGRARRRAWRTRTRR